MKLKPRKKSAWIVAAVVMAVIVIGAYVFFAKQRAAPGTLQTLPLAVAATCTDSDASQGASAIYTKGTVASVDSLGETQTLTDECANTTYLIEYICYESPVGSGHYADGRTVVKCAKGCANGACKK